MKRSSVEEDDDGGNTIIRVKPIGAGGGGVESSAQGMKDNEAGLRYQTGEGVGDGGGGHGFHPHFWILVLVIVYDCRKGQGHIFFCRAYLQ